MMAKVILDEHIVRLYGTRLNKMTQKQERNKPVLLLFWGDKIELIDANENDDLSIQKLRVRFFNYHLEGFEEGFIKKRKKSGKYQPIKFRATGILRTTFIDVQQGDATLIETPDDRVILIDGGEGKFVSRTLASLFPGTTPTNPLIIDTLIISHGDADHFKGLFEIPDSETHFQSHKRLFAKVRHYFHNGLVKSGDTSPVGNSFGNHLEHDGEFYANDLWEDPRDAAIQSKTFEKWSEKLDHLMLTPANGGQVKRIKMGDDAVFNHLSPDIQMEVLGPIEETIGGQPVLRFFRNEKGSKSAGHTINGHSIVLKMKHKNVSFLLGGDLNIDASKFLMEHLGHADNSKNIRSEIFKAPHHGSHEFHPPFFEMVNPVVSVISSGDQSSKEYVHPRANLLAALGRYSRSDQPLIFSTELAAFFAYMGFVRGPVEIVKTGGRKLNLEKGFHGFQRLIFGAVRVRTDGEYVFVAVESANSRVKESYLFRVDALGSIHFEETPKVL